MRGAAVAGADAARARVDNGAAAVDPVANAQLGTRMSMEDAHVGSARELIGAARGDGRQRGAERSYAFRGAVPVAVPDMRHD